MAGHLCHADTWPQTEESHLTGVRRASGRPFTQRSIPARTGKLEAKAASTLERLQSWPVYDALQASWHVTLPTGPIIGFD